MRPLTELVVHRKTIARVLRLFGGSLLLVFLLILLCDDVFRSRRLLTPLRKPKQYGYNDIASTAPRFRGDPPHLLVFNGSNFEAYNLVKKAVEDSYIIDAGDPHCARCVKIVPLLVHALTEADPRRFQPGQPVFQVLFSVADSAASECVNDGSCEDADQLAPILLFGSVPVDDAVFPQVQAFPNWFYLSCLYDYKIRGSDHCQWSENAGRTEAQTFESLQPTLIWRGSDFCFLPDHREYQFAGVESVDLRNASSPREAAARLMEAWDDLPPRWRAIALSVDAEARNETWIDAKFTSAFGAERRERFERLGARVSSGRRMTPREMGRYKYQVDLGGGGGTSWRGTLTKLGLPGLLFHHQTPSRDWFYGEMQPWVHFVPVAWHLGDLKEKHSWAVANEGAARQMAKNADDLFEHLTSERYMKKVYDELFVEYLNGLIEAHVNQPSGSWEDVMKQYKKDGFEVTRVSVCDRYSCTTNQRFGKKETNPFRNDAPQDMLVS